MAFNVGSHTFSATVTDAQFRAAIQFIHDVLDASPQTQASGVGTQIDPATATFPGVNNTYAGYEVWEYNDSLQGTVPIKCKLEYGRGSSASIMNLRVTVASGFDSSGVATGTTLLSLYIIGINATSPSVIQVSAGANYMVVMGHADSSFMHAIAVERTKDKNDNPTTKGLLLWGVNSSGATRRVIYWSGTQPADEAGNGGCFLPSAQTTALQPDGDTAIYPHYFFGRGETLVCSMMGMCYTLDVVTGNINTNVTVLTQAGKSIYPRSCSITTNLNWNRSSLPSAANSQWWIRAD